VKLLNGNVASRVLPIQIHDLDNADIKLCESLLGGFLRGIEFIYNEPGIDKPLAPDDDEKKNLNITKYRIQIIKVAHAIKEIIQGMKAEPVPVVKKTAIISQEPSEEVDKEESHPENEKPFSSNYRKLITLVAFLAILIIAGILAYPKIFNGDSLEGLRSSGKRISVAVMPFQNMTNDTVWNVWQVGIQEILTNSLSASVELRVCNTESVKSSIKGKGLSNYASITPALASKISSKLDADFYVLGKLIQAGSTLRVSAQLIASKTNEIAKPFQIEGSSNKDNILDLVDLLSMEIKNFLTISHLKQKELRDFQQYETTNSPDAYRNYISGMNSFGKGDFTTARDYFTLTMQYDSNFTLAALLLSQADLNLQLFEEGKEYCVKAYQKKDHMSIYMKCKINDIYAWYTEGPQGRIKYLRQLLDIDDQDPITYYHLGNSYRLLQQYDKAMPEFEKSLGIYKRWGVKPSWIFCYNQLGLVYHKEGKYKKEKKLYQKAEQDFPNNAGITYRQAILSLTEGDTLVAEKYIVKYISILKDNSSSEALIKNSVAVIYAETGILNKAEEFYRQAFSIEPENPVRINNLAYFMIDNGRDINEGLELADSLLKLSPENYIYLYTKGWGLYKQGKYVEALEILQKSWDLRRKNAIYNHEAFLNLEAAKKAVDNQKKN
jgi:tetratricopeptide (TPR) repeat protein